MRDGAWRVCLAVLAVAGTGCLPALPENVDIPQPDRTPVYEAGGATFASEEGVSDALWVEIPAADGSRTVGAYLSEDDPSARGVVILLHGASTYDPLGQVGVVRQYHREFSPFYRQAGYRTLTLDFRECGTAYGQGDLEDLLTAIDWLQGAGRNIAGADRLYTVGYSVGATIAILANRQRQITAVASICGLTSPRHVEDLWSYYQLAYSIYPRNQGICQIGVTVDTYGLPWSPGWDVLDTVGHITELRSPMIAFQGTNDQIFSSDNLVMLDEAYHAAVDSGAVLPPVSIVYLDGYDHFVPLRDPGVYEAIFAFFRQFE
jgi:dienelactone hydrolase